ncbi:hypothetical protein Poli38472_000728 [Pythium oligandrum]|uniref:Lariat debranching enzyme C-terminal domain-containing protein n=1 Tax=Pythium oligandrum TaxID=41045 RepID=A0A8K1CD25_PYTOL|nr:hypothetical protein Poli38472_000728 [Pythium oligandrum]|eukprot:TMW60686.1 hypothetical protein Poli38472_000728 [Pythium oligandrum]
MRVAVVGCTHGALDAIYEHVTQINASTTNEHEQIQLILCCGDFESLRNPHDLTCKACPPKYRHMNTFPEYYRGEKRAPILTVFIGGNHEASNYLRELYYGGWVAPNIFYLGVAGVINVGGLRIAGLSGIYGRRRYHHGFFEREPYDDKMLKSIYCVRELNVFQLGLLKPSNRLDAILSHDWPRGIERHGDLGGLLAVRPDFQTSIDVDRFGNPGGEMLLSKLQPANWLAGHMHVHFEATVVHADGEDASTTDDQVSTRFLGLDKCSSNGACVEIVDFETPASVQTEDLRIMMDEEWLAVLRKTHHLLSTTRHKIRLPREPVEITDEDLAWVRSRVEEKTGRGECDSKLKGEWPTDFVRTAPALGDVDENEVRLNMGNPQTDAFLDLLELPHIVTVPYET